MRMTEHMFSIIQHERRNREREKLLELVVVAKLTIFKRAPKIAHMYIYRCLRQIRASLLRKRKRRKGRATANSNQSNACFA